MNKSELVEQVAQQADITKAQATAVINSITASVTSTLAAGNTVSLIGFGSFQTKHRAAREGRNPQTGAAIKIAAANVPGFKAGKALKDACN